MCPSLLSTEALPPRRAKVDQTRTPPELSAESAESLSQKREALSARGNRARSSAIGSAPPPAAPPQRELPKDPAKPILKSAVPPAGVKGVQGPDMPNSSSTRYSQR